MNSQANRSDVDFARQLIEFNFWENQRVWDLAIAPLTDAQFLQAVSYANESIRDKCIHILELEATCLSQIRGDLRRSSDARDDLLDRSAIAARWQEIRRDWSQFAVGLDDERFFLACEFELDGGVAKLEVWQVIFHVIYLCTSHRSDILRMVADVHQPAEFDLSLMQFLTGVFRT